LYGILKVKYIKKVIILQSYYFDDQSDIKLIILFIMHNFKMPISNVQLADIVLSHSLTNYFDLHQALESLVSSDYVSYNTEEETIRYVITNKGIETLEFFQDRIPYSVRDMLLLTIRHRIKEINKTTKTECRIEKITSEEYVVECFIYEASDVLFSFTYRVCSKELAIEIANSFKKDPQRVYSGLLEVIIQRDKKV